MWIWSLLPLLALPLIVMAVVRNHFKQAFTVKEFFLLEAVMIAIIVAGVFLARWGAMADHEKWNGRITSKDHGAMDCCHCHDECVSRDKEGDCESYREVCLHDEDYYWSLDVSTGDTLTIKDCEPSKRAVPSAWTAAYVGEPASVEHLYTNYLLADPESVFHQSAAEELPGASVPSYPQVHSFYKADQALNLGTKMPKAAWDTGLREMNAEMDVLALQLHQESAGIPAGDLSPGVLDVLGHRTGSAR